MKLRFRKNSLRLRLNRKEVADLAAGRAIEERVMFPAGSVLRYRLEASPVIKEASAEFNESGISITIPSQSAIHWLSADDVGIYYSLPCGEGAPMGQHSDKIDEDARLPAQNRGRQGVNTAPRATKGDEDARLPALNRDCQGADVFNGAEAVNRPPLDIAIEKDLECVEAPPEERDPDAYPRKPGC